MDETVIMIRHIFLGKRIVIFFFILVFLSSRSKCRLLHFSLQLYSFLHRLNFEVGFRREKKCRKCFSSTSKVDCHKMMLMIRRASRDPGRDFTMNGNAIFSDLLLSSKPRDKKQHCHLRFADVLLLKKDSEESIASIFSKKNGTSGTNEFLPKMSSNRCRIFIPAARIDLAKIMKLMLRVSSESKYSFFNPKVIEHIVEKMDVVV